MTKQLRGIAVPGGRLIASQGTRVNFTCLDDGCVHRVRARDPTMGSNQGAQLGIAPKAQAEALAKCSHAAFLARRHSKVLGTTFHGVLRHGPGARRPDTPPDTMASRGGSTNGNPRACSCRASTSGFYKRRGREVEKHGLTRHPDTESRRPGGRTPS